MQTLKSEFRHDSHCVTLVTVSIMNTNDALYLQKENRNMY